MSSLVHFGIECLQQHRFVEEGALEGVLAVHGIHVWPNSPSGTILSKVMSRLCCSNIRSGLEGKVLPGCERSACRAHGCHSLAQCVFQASTCMLAAATTHQPSLLVSSLMCGLCQGAWVDSIAQKGGTDC